MSFLLSIETYRRTCQIHFISSRTLYHRRSQGVQWVHLHPQGGEKNFFRPNLQEKCECASPEVTKCRARVNFLAQFLYGGLHLEVYLDGLWGRWLKKRSSTLLGKSTPPDKILATPMRYMSVCRLFLCLSVVCNVSCYIALFHWIWQTCVPTHNRVDLRRNLWTSLLYFVVYTCTMSS